MLGHSFGGKVALELSRHRALSHLFLADSLPAARPEREGSAGTVRVVQMLKTLPAHFHDRPAFHAYVMELGFSKELALWLGQNLDPLSGGGYELGLDVDRIETLLHDYFVCDLWSAIDPPPGTMQSHVIIAGRSTVFGDDDRAFAFDLATRRDRVHTHVLEKADHWVHIDDPDGLHRIVVEGLK